MQSGGTTYKTDHLRILAQKGHICDGVYSEGGLYAAGRQACGLCKNGHVKNKDLLALRAGQSILVLAQVPCDRNYIICNDFIGDCGLYWPQ